MGGNFLWAVWQRTVGLGQAGWGEDLEPSGAASVARSSSATGSDNPRRW